MKVTREVILDLYPLYREGEASADTRGLVESFLAGDPEFARMLRRGEGATVPGGTPEGPRREAEMETLARTKRLLGLRGALLGLAITFTMLPLSLYVGADGVHWVFLGTPWLSAPMQLAAIGFWIAYFQVRRRLRTGGF
jgi:hypothetical protein